MPIKWILLEVKIITFFMIILILIKKYFFLKKWCFKIFFS
jgi:hypothetical protein